MTDVREITLSDEIFARSAMSASVIPSAKNSCAGSPERLASGRTAMDPTCETGMEVVPVRSLRSGEKAMTPTVSKTSPIPASTALLRVPSLRVASVSAGGGAVVARSDQADSAASSPARTSPAR
jgi:hypothetical protein